MNGKRRVRLSYAQKQAIVVEWLSRKDTGSNFDISEMADWAKLKFKLQSPPSVRMIYKILQQRNWMPVDATPSYGLRKKASCVSSSSLENALVEFIWDMYERKAFFSGDFVKEKGRMLLLLVNERLPPENRVKLEFSNGWLYCFQKRNKFKSYRSHDEDGNANDEAVRHAIPILHKRLQKYSINDVWNTDEFGLFYKMAPNIIVGPTRLRGKNKQKDRITFLAASNADGSEKMPLLAVGTSKQPRSFKGKTGKELQIEYRATENSWMNKELFIEWLKSFDSYISQKKDRKVALVIDNACCHGLVDKLPTLQYVEVIFLPKRTTSRMQPLDAGVISIMKKRFRKRQLQRAITLDKTTTDNSDLYKIDVLTTIRWMYKVWEDITCKTVYNCWAKTGLLTKCGATAVDENQLESNTVEDVHFNAVFEGEDDCVGKIDEMDLVNQIIGQGE